MDAPILALSLLRDGTFLEGNGHALRLPLGSLYARHTRAEGGLGCRRQGGSELASCRGGVGPEAFH